MVEADARCQKKLDLRVLIQVGLCIKKMRISRPPRHVFVELTTPGCCRVRINSSSGEIDLFGWCGCLGLIILIALKDQKVAKPPSEVDAEAALFVSAMSLTSCSETSETFAGDILA